jgi:hypothetical protein
VEMIYSEIPTCYSSFLQTVLGISCDHTCVLNFLNLVFKFIVLQGSRKREFHSYSNVIRITILSINDMLFSLRI